MPLQTSLFKLKPNISLISDKLRSFYEPLLLQLIFWVLLVWVYIFILWLKQWATNLCRPFQSSPSMKEISRTICCVKGTWKDPPSAPEHSTSMEIPAPPCEWCRAVSAQPIEPSPSRAASSSQPSSAESTQNPAPTEVFSISISSRGRNQLLMWIIALGTNCVQRPAKGVAKF